MSSVETLTFDKVTLKLITATIVGGIILALFNRVKKRTASKRFADENGCKPILHRYHDNNSYFERSFIKQNIQALKQNRFMDLVTSRHNSIGITFSAQPLGWRGIFTIDPENIKAVLTTKFKDFCLGDRPPIMGPLLGRGIFVTDGDEWALSRALLRPCFGKDHVADLVRVNGHIQILLNLIQDGETVDLQDLFLRFTLDSATDFLFGHSTHTLTHCTSDDKKFSDAFNYALKHIAMQFRMGPWRRFAGGFAEAAKAHSICHSYVDSFVDKAMLLKKTQSSFPNGKGLSEDHDTTQGRNFLLKELAQSTESRDKIRDELLNILIAGRDTVASLLSNMFHVLSRRPAIWDKVKNEVKRLGMDPPTYEQLHSLKYARACINETLRLYPPIPSNTRVAVGDSVLPRGGGPQGDDPIHVTKGTTVVYSVYAMHRRKDLFGHDASDFRPERWENNDKHGWAYLPFNGGPRICLGQQYAITDALLVLARFAQEFESIAARDANPWTENLTLTITPAGGTKVALYRRSVNNT